MTTWALTGSAAALPVLVGPRAEAATARTRTMPVKGPVVAKRPPVVKPAPVSAPVLRRGCIRPVTEIVQRVTVALSYRVNIRLAASLLSPVVAAVPAGVTFLGSYDETGLWFAILDGPYAGAWVSSGVIASGASSNGLVHMDDLTALPAWTINVSYSPGVPRLLSKAAAVAYLALNAQFRAACGANLTVTEGYRPLATQKVYYRQLGYPRAARPGTSNHGFGNALDLGKAGASGTRSPYSYGRSYDVWLTRNGARFGFDRPDYMDRRGSNPEFWHYNFTG